MTGKPVLITTAHRGVFYGRLAEGQDENERTLKLDRCRNVIYWQADDQALGFLGLAAKGPGADCRIGAEAPRVRIHDVTSVADCTARAAEAFESWQ